MFPGRRHMSVFLFQIQLCWGGFAYVQCCGVSVSPQCSQISRWLISRASGSGKTVHKDGRKTDAVGLLGLDKCQPSTGLAVIGKKCCVNQTRDLHRRHDAGDTKPGFNHHGDRMSSLRSAIRSLTAPDRRRGVSVEVMRCERALTETEPVMPWLIHEDMVLLLVTGHRRVLQFGIFTSHSHWAPGPLNLHSRLFWQNLNRVRFFVNLFLPARGRSIGNTCNAILQGICRKVTKNNGMIIMKNKVFSLARVFSSYSIYCSLILIYCLIHYSHAFQTESGEAGIIM